jgi:hypothetical protein
MKVGDLVREAYRRTPLDDLVPVDSRQLYLVLTERPNLNYGSFVIQSIASGEKHIISNGHFHRDCFVPEVLNESR